MVLMLSKIKKSEIINNRFAFASDEEVLINALDLCELILNNETNERLIARMRNENDILRARLALRECSIEEYRKIDLRA